MPSAGWRPIVDGELAPRAQAALEAIADALVSIVPPDATLAGGSAGLAVFFAYLAEVTGDVTHADASRRFGAHAAEALQSERLDPSLFTGFSGIAFALDHLAPAPVDRPDRLGKVDAALLRLTSRSPWRRPYDLVDGLVGIGTYAAARLPRPAAFELLDAVVARLAERAECDAAGARWVSGGDDLPVDSRRFYPERFVNLGLAHGVPGVVALLGIAVGAGVERARPLLDEAVTWMLGQRLEGSDARYPRWVAEGEDPSPARSAWCYGDPGVAAALHIAAQGANEPAWEAEAVATARLVGRRPVADTRVVDAGLCHGAAGLAHIFNRMHQDTDEAVLADHARSWVATTLDLRKQPLDDVGVLTGVAGVGLVLLAVIGDREPSWDRFLMLSAPELSRRRQTDRDKERKDVRRAKRGEDRG